MLVIGTLDTKGTEIEYLADAIASGGARPILLDSSLSQGVGTSKFPLITREEVAGASGHSMEAVAALPRGEAVEAMRGGVREMTEALFASADIHGAICIGGAGTHLSGPAFQALPIGFPKLVVSPLASGRRQFEPYVGLRDVAVMHSVADIAGINDITAKVFSSAAGYIVGASTAFRERESELSTQGPVPTVVISMNGNTTLAMDRGRERLEEAGIRP